MSEQNNININNLVILATVAEATKCVIKKLDGDGVDTQHPDNPITDDVLNNLIASRIRNHLSLIAN